MYRSAVLRLDERSSYRSMLGVLISGETPHQEPLRLLLLLSRNIIAEDNRYFYSILHDTRGTRATDD
jgi:hypothetical protein